MPDEETVETEVEETPQSTSPDMEARLAALEAERAEDRRAGLLSRTVGLDKLGTPVGQFFAENYRGELTPEAIKAEAVRIGLLEDTSQQGTASAEEREAHGTLDRMREEFVPPGNEPGPHPNDLANEAASAVRKRGNTDDAIGAWFNSRIQSAAQGDRRGTYTVGELMATGTYGDRAGLRG